MPQKLPKGWVKANLGGIYVPSRVRVLPAQVENLPYVGMEHVQSQTMRLLGHDESAELKSSSLMFNKGDVLYGKMRPYLNKVWVAEFDGLCSAEFLVFPKTEGLNSQFLAYRLNAQDFVAFANLNASGERPRVNFEKLSHFSYLLAPSREQDRIVAKLDALLSRLAAGEAATRRAMERLQRYRTAVLHAAVTGELTSNWRKTNATNESGTRLLKQLLSERRVRWEEAELKRLRAVGRPPKDHNWKKRYKEPVHADASNNLTLPARWTWASADQCTSLVTDGEHITPQRSKSGVLLLSARNIMNGRLDLEDVDHIPNTEYRRISKRLVVEPGDVLLSCSGTIGRSCVVPPRLTFALVRSVAVLKPLIKFGDYLSLALRSPLLQEEISKKTTQTAQANIFQGRIRTLALPLPPLLEIAEIVREVDRRLAAADDLAASLDRQFERAQGTRQSLLRDAFAGKLVRQDPEDEPASVLLKRIRADREATAKKPRAKNMPKAKLKTVETLEQLETLVDEMGRGATPERVLIASGLGDDVEKFFDLLRAGRDKETLIVPVGKGTAIKRARHAN